MSVAVISRFLALLALVAAAGALLVPLAVATRRDPGGATTTVRAHAVGLALLVAAVSTGGSLYYSEIAGFVPCTLCWYQRIAMYPLVVLLGVAVLHGEVGVRRYALPLAVLGLPISAYHYLIQQVPSLGSGVCSTATPCSAAWVRELGFVSIPLMAGAGFLAVIALLAVAAPYPDEELTP